jgi:hypothetical protein
MNAGDSDMHSISKEGAFFAKEDMTRQLETCSLFGCYQYHVLYCPVSAPRQFIHMFPVKTIGITAPEVFFTDARHCEDDLLSARGDNLAMI